MDCVIPAGGLSQRMNPAHSRPVPKALFSLGGRTLLARVVEQAREVCSRCFVVTGWGADEVAREAASLAGVTVVHNPDFALGMVSSILAGARQVRSEWFFVAPADMPFLSPAVYRAVLSGALAGSDEMSRGEISRGEDVFFPLNQGKRGHPVLIRRALLPELETAFERAREESRSRGSREEILLKMLLRDRSCRGVPVVTDDIRVDLDTPEELARAQERCAP